MSQVDVRSVLGNPTREFKKARGPWWQYVESGVMVHFDSSGACEAVELSRPSDPVLESVHLLSVGIASAVDSIRAADPSAVLHADGIISLQSGIALYASHLAAGPSMSNEPAQSAFVFR